MVNLPVAKGRPLAPIFTALRYWCALSSFAAAE
jgi:hypothetical protein